MAKFDNPLDNVRIASPCSADWDEMFGDERRRFCGECKLHVYNLSGMTSYDAENLLRNAEGRMCVRFYQRADGTILTKDCPVGWARMKQRLSAFATAIFSLIVSLMGSLFLVSYFTRSSDGGNRNPLPVLYPRRRPVMGNIAVSQQPRRPDSNVQKM